MIIHPNSILVFEAIQLELLMLPNPKKAPLFVSLVLFFKYDGHLLAAFYEDGILRSCKKKNTPSCAFV